MIDRLTRSASDWLRARWAACKGTRFGRDVVARPSIGPTAAWIVLGLTALVWFLAYKYAPNAIPPEPVCGPLASDHPDAPGATACVPEPESKIPELWGWVAIFGVSLAALAVGWAPIVSRNWRVVRAFLLAAAALGIALTGGWAAYVYWPRLVSEGFFALGLVRWPVAGVAAIIALTVARSVWGVITALARIVGQPTSALRGLAIVKVVLWPLRALIAVRWLTGLIVALPSVLFSALDFALVRGWAVMVGTTAETFVVRYFWLAVWIGAAVYVGWRFPAPIGPVAILVGFITILSVLRRWSWVEADRAEFIVRRGSKEEIERIGFAQDLRDEALTSLVLLFVLIPLALRQADEAFRLFHEAGTPIPDPFRWIGFFGGELAKAVPLVDWSEVFGVANGSSIEPHSPEGAISVFVLRATLDLVLITSVLQAVEIAIRLREQREAYADGHLDLIDPFAERREFRAAAPASHWDHLYQPVTPEALPQALRHYQTDRLKLIARGVPTGETPSSPVLIDDRARLTATQALAAREGAMSAEDLSLVAGPRERPAGPIKALDAVTARLFPREPSIDIRPIAFRQAVERQAAPETLLVECLDQTRPPWLRTLAAAELGRRRQSDAIDALAAIARTDGADVALRAHAAAALAKLGWAEADGVLVRVATQSGADASAALTTAYGLGIVRKDQPGAVEQIVRLFPADQREATLRAARSAVGELDRIAHLPAADFEMGAADGEAGASPDEHPRHRVAVPAFKMGVYTVTFEEYDAYCKAMGAERPADQGWGRERRPVINVSWEDAHAYCAWLNAWTGERFRLPSEAEWEYACRAGTTTPFSFGETISTAQANYDGSGTYGAGEKGEYRRQTVPVGSFPANPFGLYDMHGNVWEWCADVWHGNYAGAPDDGSAWIAGGYPPLRVLRGGSWLSNPRVLRSADRGRSNPTVRGSGRGFRLARTV